MRKLALFLLLLAAFPAQAADNFAVTAGTGTTIATKDLAGVHITKHNLVDQTGAEVGVSAVPWYIRAGSGALASGSIASGAIASGAVASGAYASGAFASGAFASGSMASGSCADGCNVLLGAKADAKSTATDTTAISAMQVWKQISASVQAMVTAMTDTTIGVAPPSGANYIAGSASGATGGLIAGVKVCDLHAFYTGTDTGRKTVIAGVASRKTYICSFLLSTAADAATLTLWKGTDADCATSGAAIGPPYALLANDKVGIASSFWNGFVTATNADYVCVNSSAAVQHTAEIWYTIQ